MAPWRSSPFTPPMRVSPGWPTSRVCCAHTAALSASRRARRGCRSRWTSHGGRRRCGRNSRCAVSPRRSPRRTAVVHWCAPPSGQTYSGWQRRGRPMVRSGCQTTSCSPGPCCGCGRSPQACGSDTKASDAPGSCWGWTPMSRELISHCCVRCGRLAYCRCPVRVALSAFARTHPRCGSRAVPDCAGWLSWWATLRSRRNRHGRHHWVPCRHRQDGWLWVMLVGPTRQCH